MLGHELEARVRSSHPDSDGEDSWLLSIFDSDGDHSESLVEEVGAFSQCVLSASEWIVRNPHIKYPRIVIERTA